MRFVAVKTAEQQSLMMLHRTRSLLIRQRTMLVNAIRAHLAEFGIVAPVGLRGLKALLAVICDPTDERLPSLARTCLESLVASLMTVEHEAACKGSMRAAPSCSPSPTHAPCRCTSTRSAAK
jgi:transposase